MKKKIETAVQQLKQEGKSISKKAIADILNVNLSTVYRNWNESLNEHLTPESIPLNLLASLQKENKQLKEEVKHFKAKVAALETQLKDISSIELSKKEIMPSTDKFTDIDKNKKGSKSMKPLLLLCGPTRI